MTGSSGKIRNCHFLSTFQHQFISVKGVPFSIHTFKFKQYIHENSIHLCVYTLCKGDWLCLLWKSWQFFIFIFDKTTCYGGN